MKFKRTTHDLLKYFRRLLIGLLIVVPVLMFAVQIPRVNTKITEWTLNYLLASKEISFKISKISGSFPFHITAHKVNIEDKYGHCATIDKLMLSCKGVDLFFGNIHFDKITVSTITLQRIPSKLLEVNDDPIYLPYLNIDSIKIQKLSIPFLYPGSLGLYGNLSSTRDDVHKLLVRFLNQESNEPFFVYDQKGIDYRLQLDIDRDIVFFRDIAPEAVARIQQGNIRLAAFLEGKTDFIFISGYFKGSLENVQSDIPLFHEIIGSQAQADFKFNRYRNQVTVKDGIIKTQGGAFLKLNYQKTFPLGTKTEGKLLIPHCHLLLPSYIPAQGPLTINFAYESKEKQDALTVKLTDLSWGNASTGIYPKKIEHLFLSFDRSQEVFSLSADLKHPSVKMKLAGSGHYDMPEKGTSSVKVESLSLKGTGFDIATSGKLSIEGGGQGVSQPWYTYIKQFKVAGTVSDLIPLGNFLDRDMGGMASISIDYKNNNLLGEGIFTDIRDPLILSSFDLNKARIHANLQNWKGPIAFDMESSLGKLMMRLGIQPVMSGAENSFQVFPQELVYEYKDKKRLVLEKSQPLEISLDRCSIPETIFKVGEGLLSLKKIKCHWCKEEGAEQENYQSLSGDIILSHLEAFSFNDLMDIPALKGQLNGHLKLKKEGYDLDLDLKQFGLQMTNRKHEKVIDGTLKIHYKENQLMWKGDLKRSRESGTLSQLTWTGSVQTETLFPSDEALLKSSLTGTFDVSFLNGFFGWEDRYKGILNIALNSTGTFGSPVSQGYLNLENGYFENAAFGTILKDVDIKGNLAANKLTIKNMTARDFGKGQITGNGHIDFTDYKNPKIDVYFSLDKILLANTDETMLSTSGQLQLHSMTKNLKEQPTDSSLELKGKLTLNSALIILTNITSEPKNIRIYRTPKDLERKEQKIKDRGGPALDIEIVIPKKLYLQGYGLHSEWAGKLTVLGTTSLPEVKGSIQALNGYLDVANKRLTLDKSSIFFSNVSDKKGGHLEPILNIKAKKVVDDYAAYVLLTGPTSDPKITFISDPALSSEEVIALILFNKPLKNATAAQSLQLATALANLKTGSLTGGAFDSLNQILGVDEIGFQNSNSEGGDTGDALSSSSLRIGKQLNDRIYVGVEQGIEDENETKALMKIDLTKNTKIDLETGTYDSAVGYNWEMRY